MELDAVDAQAAVAACQYLAVLRSRRHLELVGHRGRRERVVAPGLEVLREADEDPAAVVRHRARLPVHEALRLPDLSAEGLDDRLVAEAHAERRGRRREPANDLHGRAGALRPPGSRRDDEVGGTETLRPVRVDLVVAAHDHLSAELLEQVDEVVREAVVVVDEQDHRSDSASVIAVSRAASFRRHSSCSACGSESATIPAPAWRWATRSWSTTVRIAMQVSRSPFGCTCPTAPPYGPRR